MTRDKKRGPGRPELAEQAKRKAVCIMLNNAEQGSLEQLRQQYGHADGKPCSRSEAIRRAVAEALQHESSSASHTNCTSGSRFRK